jgi:hypothetical protein
MTPSLKFDWTKIKFRKQTLENFQEGEEEIRQSQAKEIEEPD